MGCCFDTVFDKKPKGITVKDLVVAHIKKRVPVMQRQYREVGTRFAVMVPDGRRATFAKKEFGSPYGRIIHIDRVEGQIPPDSMSVGIGVDISTAIRSAKRAIVKWYNETQGQKGAAA